MWCRYDIDGPDLVYKYTTDYEVVWLDRESGGDNDGGIWRAKQVDGYCSIGDVAVNNDNGAPPEINSVLVASQKPGVLIHPTGFNEVWSDAGSGAQFNVRI